MFHAATKVTFVTERLLQEGIVKILEADGAKGYTVVDGAGKGEHLKRAGDRATLVSAFSIVRIEALFADRKTAETVAKDVSNRYFGQHSGIVYLSAIEVLRPERF